MVGCVEGIHRALVLGLVLTAGTAIEQAPSVGPLLLSFNNLIPVNNVIRFEIPMLGRSIAYYSLPI